MNVIFLDIDGVLNSFRNILAFGRFPFPEVTEDVPGHGMGPESELDALAIGMIRKLCDLTGAKIVLHSMWRKHMDVQKFGERHKLPVIDATARNLPKHLGIFDWLRQHKEVGISAIIDDDPILSVQFHPADDEQAALWLQMHDSFIQTNMEHGFTFLNFVNTFLVFSDIDIDEIREKNKRLKELRKFDLQHAAGTLIGGIDERTKEERDSNTREMNMLTEELSDIGVWSVLIMLDSMENQ